MEESWKNKYLERIDNVRTNYSFRAQKIIQPMYIREVIEQIPHVDISPELQSKLEEKLDRLYAAIPNVTETSPKTFKTYRSHLEDFKFFINSEFNLLPIHYFKSVYIPIGIAFGLLIGLLIGFLIKSPSIGYLIGAILGGIIGYIIGHIKDQNKGTNKRFA